MKTRKHSGVTPRSKINREQGNKSINCKSTSGVSFLAFSYSARTSLYGHFSPFQAVATWTLRLPNMATNKSLKLPELVVKNKAGVGVSVCEGETF